MSQNEISRRRVLELGVGAGTAVGLGLGALYLSRREPQIKKYEGQIERLKGLPLIEDGDLGKMLDSLEATGMPLLAKISHDLRVALVVNYNDGSYPAWIKGESFPLRVTRNDSSISEAAAEAKVSPKPEDKFIYSTNGKAPEIIPEPSGMTIAINLGLTQKMKEADPLLRGFLLAKEYLSHLAIIAVSDDMFEALGQNPDIKITDLENKPITDIKKQQAVGRTMTLLNLRDMNSDVYKIIDGFPIMLLASAVIFLKGNNKLPEGFLQLMDSFITANNLVYKRDVSFWKEAMGAVNVWVNGNGTLFPKGTGLKAMSEPIASFILELQSEIAKRKLLPRKTS